MKIRKKTDLSMMEIIEVLVSAGSPSPPRYFHIARLIQLERLQEMILVTFSPCEQKDLRHGFLAIELSSTGRLKHRHFD